MKNKEIFYKIMVVVTLTIVGFGLFVLKQPSILPVDASESNFNMMFKYGIGAKNELNTSKGTYTKDMVIEPPITVNLSLSKTELDKIYQKMIEINFFDYPDEFSAPAPPGELIARGAPYSSYYFKVTYDSKVKELWWADNIGSKDKKVEKLRGLIGFIKDIIESKAEYKKLPSPRGGYM